MNTIQSKIKGMLLGTITGDALGTPLDGLTQAHIKAVYKNIDTYTDPSPALKGNPQNWKKPGSYSSISQLMILMSLTLFSNKRNNFEAFIESIGNTPETGEDISGIFRHPDHMIKYLISRAKYPANTTGESFSAPCSRTALILLPLAIRDSISYETLSDDTFNYSIRINRDLHSIAGTLIINSLMKRMTDETGMPVTKIISLAVQETASILKIMESFSGKIFDSGMNPVSLLSSIKDYLNILSGIKNETGINEAEKTIYNYLNTKIKTPVTRATVDHPLAIIPYSIYVTSYFAGNPEEILFRAAEKGGSTAVLCSLTGALTGASHGIDSIPENLINTLINKKRILSITEAIAGKKIPNDSIKEFVQSESSLTLKEEQERNAKLRHIKIKPQKKKSRKEAEKELSAHIVESWTKLDKAKWRKKINKSKE